MQVNIVQTCSLSITIHKIFLIKSVGNFIDGHHYLFLTANADRRAVSFTLAE